MSRYVLDHHLAGEKKRLSLMSQLLDPMHRRCIESLGISRDARVLEVGCGNGSMSVWMAEHIGPAGQIIGVDLDLSLVDDAPASGVKFRQGDIVAGPVNPGCFDFRFASGESKGPVLTFCTHSEDGELSVNLRSVTAGYLLSVIRQEGKSVVSGQSVVEEAEDLTSGSSLARWCRCRLR